MTEAPTEVLRNPMSELRRLTGLNRRKFALRHGIEHQAIERVELGVVKNLSPQVKTIFQRAGIGPEEAESQYQAWKQAQAVEGMV